MRKSEFGFSSITSKECETLLCEYGSYINDTCSINASIINLNCATSFEVAVQIPWNRGSELSNEHFCYACVLGYAVDCFSSKVAENLWKIVSAATTECRLKEA